MHPGSSHRQQMTGKQSFSAQRDGRSSGLTWQELILRLAGLHSGAHKGDPHVLGRHIVLVGAAEDINVRAPVHLQAMGISRLYSCPVVQVLVGMMSSQPMSWRHRQQKHGTSSRAVKVAALDCRQTYSSQHNCTRGTAAVGHSCM